ncbi:MAG: hydrogenase expression/formation protein HypE [Desulfobacteraceae bacterium]|nr:hydrogenase expression/formation protein HypE [Desulfobacteraceae bacterium]MBC2756126.1 hydrogenase expression/formation protein HypE [Desulfobacteraceae bacterium]
MSEKKITLAHGNGGKLTHETISSIFVPAFNNPELRELADAACVSVGGQRIAFTTDSHVISPIFFPGGDIGKLAVAGTVNDLAVMGARPMYLSCGLIIEEGFGVDDLRKIVQSMSVTAKEAGVHIVTGDTKVVEKGAADGIFINTSGIGLLSEKVPKGMKSIQVGDAVILSGSLGDHGVAIYSKRENLLLKNSLKSDCAIILPLVEKAMGVCDSIRIMRDPTRGGLATTLNEFVSEQAFGIEIVEENIPVKEAVMAVCEMLGFDPLYMANEGKVVMVVPAESAEEVVSALKSLPLGRDAAFIGHISGEFPGKVCLKTLVSGERMIDMLVNDPFPRIC